MSSTGSSEPHPPLLFKVKQSIDLGVTWDDNAVPEKRQECGIRPGRVASRLSLGGRPGCQLPARACSPWLPSALRRCMHEGLCPSEVQMLKWTRLSPATASQMGVWRRRSLRCGRPVLPDVGDLAATLGLSLAGPPAVRDPGPVLVLEGGGGTQGSDSTAPMMSGGPGCGGCDTTRGPSPQSHSPAPSVGVCEAGRSFSQVRLPESPMRRRRRGGGCVGERAGDRSPAEGRHGYCRRHANTVGGAESKRCFYVQLSVLRLVVMVTAFLSSHRFLDTVLPWAQAQGGFAL